jgi:hypothetical protein
MPRPPRSPTISCLIEQKQALHLGCIPCGRDRYLSPLEAVATYGGQITFEELRTLLRARCGGECKAVAEPSIRKPDELTVKKRAP